MDLSSKINTLVFTTKAPNIVKATKHADEIAYPFPIAAVVLPAASKLSVVSLTWGGKFDIVAIPPALSEIGPYASMDREIVILDKIPKAVRQTPYRPQREKEVKIETKY